MSKYWELCYDEKNQLIAKNAQVIFWFLTNIFLNVFFLIPLDFYTKETINETNSQETCDTIKF